MLTDAHTASVSFSFRMFILFTTSNPKALFFYHNVISPDLNVPLNDGADPFSFTPQLKVTTTPTNHSNRLPLRLTLTPFMAHTIFIPFCTLLEQPNPPRILF